MTKQYEGNGIAYPQQLSELENLEISETSETELPKVVIESEVQPFTADASIEEGKPVLEQAIAFPPFSPNLVMGIPLKIQPTQSPKSPVLQWFYDLPISGKQLVGLFLSEAISVLGIAGVGALLIIAAGRSQLLTQAKSEVAVTELSYMVKVNQMGFGFRGQSDNPAIIAAARTQNAGKPVDDKLQNQVGQILKNEVKARNIEYATLVGRDLKIIASANANRKGELFNPNNLVTDVINDPKQLKASAVVGWQELKKEAPPLPQGVKDEDALIRYTVTPVQDPANKSVIGALISGDIVNGKLPIAEAALNAFDGGYSAIYFRKPDGTFSLATSLKKQENAQTVERELPLSDTAILSAAVAANGDKVTQRLKIGDQTYTVAAMTLPNIYQQQNNKPVPISKTDPVAILVRGTPETSLNALMARSLKLELAIVALAVLANILLARLIGQTISQPLKHLQQATQLFMQGDRQARSTVLARDEVGQVAASFNQLADTIAVNEQSQAAESKRQKLLSDIARARTSQELTAPLNDLLLEVRETLKSDRLVIYRFLPDWSGEIAGESLSMGWASALADKIEDACIGEALREVYRQGRVLAIENVFKADFHPQHLQLLQRLQVKSSLIVPIVQGEDLFGLAIAHHCQQCHQWQAWESESLQQFAHQLAQSLAGLSLLEGKQLDAERGQEQNQAIQEELLKLLTDVEGAASGDLTVRAEITAGQIGIVADFFNAILESLREIVTQVKQATSQVNQSLGKDETAMHQLAQESRKQAKKIQRMLEFVEQMAQSIQEVAENATAAADVARTATQTAQTGGIAMDQTVESIMQLRETVSETAKKVKRLGESSQQISKVISLINEIALKTNLLAVNASIEAARAGEEGRGFAVVAEEVGQLAVQSAAATKEIGQIVETIQRETSQVVEAMEVGTSQVVQGTRLVAEAKESLEQIVSESRQIDQLVQLISTATVSQGKTSEMVTNFMKDIAKVSDVSSEASSDVSQSLQETVAIAQQLQASVEAFKVDVE